MRACHLLFTGIFAFLASNATATVRYVDVNSANPTPPYSDWGTAAMTIQDAIDAAEPGDEVLVTNGVYRTGGYVPFGILTNRVAVIKPLTVRSVNGPFVTTIEGYQVPGAILGASAVRCVYLDSGASLSGFTLTNGATLSLSDSPLSGEGEGGGVYCNFEAPDIVVSNCILTNNAALAGGGGFGGRFHNCLFGGNVATGNLTFGSSGGGANLCTMNNCTLIKNSADQGGGAYDSELNNCIVYHNTAPAGSNYSATTLNYCCTTPLPASGTGNFET
jgi:hypothetical protein